MKTVLYNGKIYIDKGCFEEALLQEDGIITAVGSNEDVLALAGDAERYDCGGRTVLPGMNDSHQHLMEFGKSLTMPHIGACRSVEEMVEVCKTFLADHPDCKAIIAAGWNESNFDHDKRRLPTRHDLDRISTRIPIVLSRVCLHCAVANTLALECADLASYRPVEGGKVEVDEQGVPNGRLYENATTAVMDAMPQRSPAELADCLAEGMKYAVSHGLTTVQCNDAGTTASLTDVTQALDMVYKSGRGLLRYVSQTGVMSLEEMKGFVTGPLHQKTLYGGLLKYGPIKLFKDGSLGARSSLMRRPYADDPTTVGVERLKDEEHLAMLRYGNETHTQIVTHCIGDGASEKTLRLYKQANGGSENPNRHCIIHFQITDEEMVRCAAENHILVAYQPAFLEYDLHICDDRVGKALGSTSYCFKSAYDKGVRTSFGSDCPVEDCNPFCGIYCAVTRQDYHHQPEGGWNPQERVSVEEAIDMYTVESAYHEFAEETKGRLKTGFLADLIVLDTDIFSCPPKDILSIKPVMTMVNGRIVYRT